MYGDEFFDVTNGRVPEALPGAEEGGGVRLPRSKFLTGAPPSVKKFRDTAKGLLIKASIRLNIEARHIPNDV